MLDHVNDTPTSQHKIQVNKDNSLLLPDLYAAVAQDNKEARGEGFPQERSATAKDGNGPHKDTAKEALPVLNVELPQETLRALHTVKTSLDVAYEAYSQVKSGKSLNTQFSLGGSLASLEEHLQNALAHTSLSPEQLAQIKQVASVESKQVQTKMQAELQSAWKQAQPYLPQDLQKQHEELAKANSQDAKVSKAQHDFIAKLGALTNNHQDPDGKIRVFLEKIQDAANLIATQQNALQRLTIIEHAKAWISGLYALAVSADRTVCDKPEYKDKLKQHLTIAINDPVAINLTGLESLAKTVTNQTPKGKTPTKRAEVAEDPEQPSPLQMHAHEQTLLKQFPGIEKWLLASEAAARVCYPGNNPALQESTGHKSSKHLREARETHEQFIKASQLFREAIAEASQLNVIQLQQEFQEKNTALKGKPADPLAVEELKLLEQQTLISPQIKIDYAVFQYNYGLATKQEQYSKQGLEQLRQVVKEYPWLGEDTSLLRSLVSASLLGSMDIAQRGQEKIDSQKAIAAGSARNAMRKTSPSATAAALDSKVGYVPSDPVTPVLLYPVNNWTGINQEKAAQAAQDLLIGQQADAATTKAETAKSIAKLKGAAAKTGVDLTAGASAMTVNNVCSRLAQSLIPARFRLLRPLVPIASGLATAYAVEEGGDYLLNRTLELPRHSPAENFNAAFFSAASFYVGSKLIPGSRAIPGKDTGIVKPPLPSVVQGSIVANTSPAEALKNVQAAISRTTRQILNSPAVTNFGQRFQLGGTVSAVYNAQNYVPGIAQNPETGEKYTWDETLSLHTAYDIASNYVTGGLTSAATVPVLKTIGYVPGVVLSATGYSWSALGGPALTSRLGTWGSRLSPQWLSNLGYGLKNVSSEAYNQSFNFANQAGQEIARSPLLGYSLPIAEALQAYEHSQLLAQADKKAEEILRQIKQEETGGKKTH